MNGVKNFWHINIWQNKYCGRMEKPLWAQQTSN